MKAIGIIVLVLAVGVPSAWAQSTQTLHQSVDAFAQGELDGLAIDHLGQLVVAPVSVTSLPTGALYSWALALDGRGRLWAGTGERGGVVRLEDGEFELVANTLALQVLSLMPFGDLMLAGSSPDGVVYAIDDDGNVEVALDVPQQTVWALAHGTRKGTWLAATGPGARLVRGGEGVRAGEVLHDLAATNLTALLRDDKGLWLGTQGPGLVLRIDGDDANDPRLRFETGEEEIVALTADGDGGVFVLGVDMSGDNNSGHSRVTWLPAGGGNETVWEGEHRLISMTATDDGAFLVGEAESGRVYRLDREGRFGLWAELEGGDPLAILVDGESSWVATGNLGTVFALEPAKGGRGSFESTVIETPLAEKWGRLWVESWGDEVLFSVRSGVRSFPDDTWSEWSDWKDAGAIIDAPVAPYLQYRLELGDATVASAHLAYAERNLAPKLTKLVIEAPGGDLYMGGGMGNGGMPVGQQFDDGLMVEYSVGMNSSRAEPEDVAWARGLRSVVWEASDENDDPLEFEVKARRLPDGDWFTLAREIDAMVWAWDTRAVADGHYRLKVIARDTPADALRAGREASLVGPPVRVDNTSPVLADVSHKDGVLRFAVSDPGSTISEVDARWDESQAWSPLAPVDGVLDSPSEKFELSLSEAKGTLRLRLVDAAGNVLTTAIHAED